MRFDFSRLKVLQNLKIVLHQPLIFKVIKANKIGHVKFVQPDFLILLDFIPIKLMFLNIVCVSLGLAICEQVAIMGERHN
jgi:hypothetical protein